MATFPFDLLFSFAINYSQLLKTFKLIRLARLTRIFKLTKLLSFLNLNQIIKTEFGKIFTKIYKRNRGYLDLFTNIFYILISAH